MPYAQRTITISFFVDETKADKEEKTVRDSVCDIINTVKSPDKLRRIATAIKNDPKLVETALEFLANK